MKSANQKGFTLLEAMVAIIVLSMSLFASYSWIDVSVQSLARSDQIFSQELLVSEFLERMAIVDLRSVQRGNMKLGEFELDWSAQPLEIREGRTKTGYEGLYRHSLFNVEVSVLHRGQLVSEFRTRFVASKQIREPRYER